MAFYQKFLSSPLITTPFVATIVVGAISAYATITCVYRLYFHPLSKFPGPRIAAVSHVWYAYHWLSGRYPWAIETVLNKYGSVVRVAPNELVFYTPQAFIDIYSPHTKSLELFRKTDFQNRGKNLGGIIWEEDPVRHRETTRKVAPAFSSRSIRAMEPVIHEYMDYFVERMKEVGGGAGGVDLGQWTNWLAMDTSADVTCNEKFHEMRDMKSSLHLDVIMSFNSFATVMQVFKRFPLLYLAQLLFVPFPKLLRFLALEGRTRDGVRRRIKKMSSLEHPDVFEHLLPANSPLPTTKSELTHLGSLYLQITFAGSGPVADWYYGTLFFLTEQQECYKILVEEIRNKFQTYEEITPAALASLPYLNACLSESLRLMPSNNTGLPRYSPGAVVDGHYVSKGTTLQTSVFALGRSPQFFHNPLSFLPQRWLPPSHPLHDPIFSADDLKGLPAFSLGPRVCIGKELAWLYGRLFLAKVLWKFDVRRVEGQRLDLERDLLHYGFLEKPQFRVRFVVR